MRIEANPSETVLVAARRAGIPLSSDCEVGDCQTCRATCFGGDLDYEDGASVSLSRQEIDAGEMLPCVASARTDVRIRLPYERGKLIPAKPFSMKIESIERLSASVVRVVTRTLGLSPIRFLPGQYVNFHVPGTTHWRSYSMANSPGDDRCLEFLVRLLEDGEMSRYLTERAAVGDVVQCRGPQGVFYLRSGERPVLMVAGGTGVAPMMSMLRQIKAPGESRNVTLCFGVNSADDLFFVDELNELARAIPELDVRIAVAQGPSPTGISQGLVTDLIGERSLSGHDVYLCGPPAMADSARRIAIGLGAAPDNVIAERFVAAGAAA
ncbi:FAD-binding oxidoreductase [Bradyrhizobium diversitatis]|uniref:2Fe-2S iron-sulfur cluster binding domain-containing protein n=1 Tax=Bradyrhizobium diversitatis TaxID=2755406 RepID=A0ABS0P8E9_9BRAD|nr:2Fe-2S iron-sulfur cluster binding domain-containing protein [Bradyrhizobium diversitatis]MBH5389536.1 2Fe-2S iron-sulfur cluster binding domain-containing protein [Bradyrhizobium diversitatis]